MSTTQPSPSEKETLENNKLIADFMGVKIGVELYSWRPGCTEPLQEKHLNYHESWGWIMPVVERIEDLGYYIGIDRHFCMIGTIDTFGLGIQHLPTVNAVTKIEAVYKQCIAFINWYNNQPKK
jgi:hypothetical protein